jgi:hypothetical protein
MAAPASFTDLDIRRDERGLLVGGTQMGKSTLAEYLGSAYCTRYSAKRLILDSKPRYRAEWKFDGLPAKRLYRRYRPDPAGFVAGSVLVTPDLPEEPHRLLAQAFTRTNTVIATIHSKVNIPWLTALAHAFHDGASHRKPRILQVDETMDFFTAQGQPIGGDAIEVSARAGSEVGEAALYCSQRTKRLSTSLLAEMSKLYCFSLDNVGDADRLTEFGVPEFMPPLDKHQFRYWTKLDKRHVYGPYFLDLAQLR